MSKGDDKLRDFACSPTLGFCYLAFVFLPGSLIFLNGSDLGDPWQYLSPFVLSFFVAVSILSVVIVLIGERQSRIFNRFLLFLTLYFFLKELLVPVRLGQLETGFETPAEPMFQIVVEMLLVAALGVFSWRVTEKAVTRIAWLVLFWCFFQSAVLVVQFPAPRFHAGAEGDHMKTPTAFGGNIYHFVFDAYMGPWFGAMIDELDLAHKFKDFVHFKNIRSNYLSTRPSVVSFTTGTMYRGGASVSNWMEKRPEHSIMTELNAEGFESSSFAIHDYTQMSEAHHKSRGNPTLVTLVADLWLLRLVPVPLRSEVFARGSGVVSRLIQGPLPSDRLGNARLHVASFRQFKKILEIEKNRPAQGQYVYAHFYFPHPPWVFDRNGLTVGRSSYLEQVLFATRCMAEFINTIKQAGHYEDALIIFQSDHGDKYPLPKLKRADRKQVHSPVISPKDAEAIGRVDLVGVNGNYVDPRSRPLLAVKFPKRQAQALTSVGALTQLLDLPDLIRYSVRNPDFGRAGNLDILVKRLTRKEVHIQSDWRQYDPKTGTIVLINRIAKGKINHYVIDDQNQFFVRPDIPFVWDSE